MWVPALDPIYALAYLGYPLPGIRSPGSSSSLPPVRPSQEEGIGWGWLLVIGALALALGGWAAMWQRNR
ncbi:hypothetical protein GCM10009550_67770 [Actinocorallia libanotica]|uniref:ABC-2 type transport system permease protein n=1 Tax=Actinocorallia libanotica TaxID=46162 RepID=A0ABN1RWZ1_9ACTN